MPPKNRWHANGHHDVGGISVSLKRLDQVLNADVAYVDDDITFTGIITIAPPIDPSGLPNGAFIVESVGGPQGDGRVSLHSQSEDDDHPLGAIKLWVASSDAANFRPEIRAYRARGSFAAPSILQLDNGMLNISARGFTVAGAGPEADGYEELTRIVFSAAENWVASTSYATLMAFQVTAVGATTPATGMTLSGTGLTVAKTVLISRTGGEPSLSFRRDLANNPTWSVGRLASSTLRFIYSDDVTVEAVIMQLQTGGLLDVFGPAATLFTPRLSLTGSNRPQIALDHTGATGSAGTITWRQGGSSEGSLFYVTSTQQWVWFDHDAAVNAFILDRDSGGSWRPGSNGRATLGISGTRWGKLWGQDADFSAAVLISGDLTLDAQLVFSAAASQIIPGATSLSLRNNADSADNVLVTDAGTVTLRNLLDFTNHDAGGTAYIRFFDPDVAHGMTTIAPTDMLGWIGPRTTTAGGVRMWGFQEGNDWGVQIKGLQGTAGATAAVMIEGAKKSGTSSTLLGAGEVEIQLSGGFAPTYIYGDGVVRVLGEVRISGDIGGAASHNTLTGTSDLSGNSTGVGTIKFKGASNRDSTGFIKFYIGTTAYYVPVFSAITG